MWEKLANALKNARLEHGYIVFDDETLTKDDGFQKLCNALLNVPEKLVVQTDFGPWTIPNYILQAIHVNLWFSTKQEEWLSQIHDEDQTSTSREDFQKTFHDSVELPYKYVRAIIELFDWQEEAHKEGIDKFLDEVRQSCLEIYDIHDEKQAYRTYKTAATQEDIMDNSEHKVLRTGTNLVSHFAGTAWNNSKTNSDLRKTLADAIEKLTQWVIDRTASAMCTITNDTRSNEIWQGLFRYFPATQEEGKKIYDWLTGEQRVNLYAMVLAHAYCGLNDKDFASILDHTQLNQGELYDDLFVNLLEAVSFDHGEELLVREKAVALDIVKRLNADHNKNAKKALVTIQQGQAKLDRQFRTVGKVVFSTRLEAFLTRRDLASIKRLCGEDAAACLDFFRPKGNVVDRVRWEFRQGADAYKVRIGTDAMLSTLIKDLMGQKARSPFLEFILRGLAHVKDSAWYAGNNRFDSVEEATKERQVQSAAAWKMYASADSDRNFRYRLREHRSIFAKLMMKHSDLSVAIVPRYFSANVPADIVTLWDVCEWQSGLDAFDASGHWPREIMRDGLPQGYVSLGTMVPDGDLKAVLFADGMSASLADIQIPPFQYRMETATIPITGMQSGVSNTSSPCAAKALRIYLKEHAFTAEGLLSGTTIPSKIAVDLQAQLSFGEEPILAFCVESLPGVPIVGFLVTDRNFYYSLLPEGIQNQLISFVRGPDRGVVSLAARDLIEISTTYTGIKNSPIGGYELRINGSPLGILRMRDGAGVTVNYLNEAFKAIRECADEMETEGVTDAQMR